MLFALFATAANGVLLGLLWEGPEGRIIRLASEVALVGVWLVGMASVLRLTVLADRDALRKRKEEKIREGLMLYLRSEHGEALRAFDEARRCDVEGTDLDVLFHLGMISSRLGDNRRARTYFRRCLAWDKERRWRAEIEEELRRVEAGRDAASTPARPEPAGPVPDPETEPAPERPREPAPEPDGETR